MAEGTLTPAPDVISSSSFNVEYNMTASTGVFRTSMKLSDFPRIATLRSLYASVIVTKIVAEARQAITTGTEEGYLFSKGHIFIGLIPTSRDTDAQSGATSETVLNVPNKQTFPLSDGEQMNKIFDLDLTGYEVDLAQDPRRGAGLVAWIGNSGVIKRGAHQLPICSVTWRVTVLCTGSTPLWS